MVTTTASLNPLYIQTPVISALDHDEMIFMAPELLAPSKYGLASVVPTKEADIYAFGMLILQVPTFDCHHSLLSLTSHRFWPESHFEV